ncbi:MAG: hypothetical protein AAGC73_04225 [Verrucomicrobiota bacterium]
MNILKALTGSYSWKFRRVGGIYQVQLDTVDDLRALEELDPKLWVALSCPVNGLEIDAKTLQLIDYETDGRVRIEEMLAAVRWTLERLEKPESLFVGGDLPLEAIKTSDPEGAALIASARQILTNLGEEDPQTISVAAAANTAKIYGQSRLNGDGVISHDATKDKAVQQLITDIIHCVGAEKDRSGVDGITQKKLEAFFTQAQHYERWWTRGEIDSQAGEDIFPLGDKTPQAFEHYIKVERKIDDFFARCQLAAFDPRAEEPLNHDVTLYKSLAEENFADSQLEVEALPLATITKNPELTLESGINPEWKARFDHFRREVLAPLNIGPEKTINLEQWQNTKNRFSGYIKWRKEKPDTGVEKIGITQIRSILKSDTKDKLLTLLREDAALAPRMKSVDAVEKLARYHRDLVLILKNFVNFNDFYDESCSAIFQAGELFLDGRECKLCLRVDNPTKHAALASLSRAYVTYCQCWRKDSPKTFYIAAVFSDGDSANLTIGRNGVFRDKAGKLWDTTVIRMIENPISLREAFWMPYLRIGRYIGEQLEKWAVSRDKEIQKQMETGIDNTAKVSSQKSEATKSNNLGGAAGMVAAAGIALGAVGAGIASLFNTVKALAWWELPLVITGILLMISLPSMIIAWLKIRKRTLAPLLDASGWAVNGRTLISFKLGRILTARAKLPSTALCKFDERNSNRRLIWLITGLVIVAAATGLAFLFL